MDHLQTTPYLPSTVVADGATTDCSDRHLVAVYYSCIDPGRIKGCSAGTAGIPDPKISTF